MGSTRLKQVSAGFSDPDETAILTPTKNKADAMNSSQTMNHREILRVKLAMMLREHRDLDDAIHALDASRLADQLTLRRLKKQKLALKDQIARIEDELTPDIIA